MAAISTTTPTTGGTRRLLLGVRAAAGVDSVVVMSSCTFRLRRDRGCPGAGVQTRTGWRGGSKAASQSRDKLNPTIEHVCLHVDELLLGLEQAEAAVDRIELRSEAGAHAHLVETHRVAQALHDTGLLCEVLIRRTDVGDRVRRLTYGLKHSAVIVGHRRVKVRGCPLKLRAPLAAFENRKAHCWTNAVGKGSAAEEIAQAARS